MHYKYPEEASYNPADKDCVGLEEAFADCDRCTDCNGPIPVPGVCKDCFMARYKVSWHATKAEKKFLEKLTSFENARKQDPNDKPKLYILED